MRQNLTYFLMNKTHFPIFAIRLMVGLVFSFFVLTVSYQVIAQNLGQRGSVVVKIPFHTQQDLQFLADQIDVWEVQRDPGYVIAAVTPAQLDLLTTNGFSFTIDDQKTYTLHNPTVPLPNQTTGIGGYPCYRTVEETYQTLVDLETAYPKLAHRVDIGDSWDKIHSNGNPGYDLWVLVLSNQNIPGPKPKFFIMAAVHAREYATAELATRFAEYLLQNYGTDADITWLLDYYEVHILPQANPDGRKIAEEGVLWRKNTDNDDGCNDSNYWGVDLNRNSSYAWGGWGTSTDPCSELYKGPLAASEPEIQAMESYVRNLYEDRRGPDDNDLAPLDTSGLFISLHSYGELILWPWGHTDLTAPNHTQLQTLGRKMAYFNYYIPEQSNNLYGTSGTNEEFAYGELGIAGYTFEIGTDFFETCSNFESTIYPRNLKSLLIGFKSTHFPYMAPSGPEITQIDVTPTSVLAGDTVTITVTLDDTRFSAVTGSEPSQVISGAQLSIDTPPWISPIPPYYFFQPVDGVWDEKVETAQVVINTTGFIVGKHLLFIHAQDAASNWGLYSAAYLEILSEPPPVKDQWLFMPLLITEP
jgi:carboxypeptidase T